MQAGERSLLNDWQHGFPLVERPFEALATTTGLDEAEVIACFSRWRDQGLVSRIGAVFATRRVGASALAALAAPSDRFEAIAARVSAIPEVNHNYEREHRYNLWFVITAATPRRLEAVVAEIEAKTSCAVIVLPMEEAHHIDLGFDLVHGRGRQGRTGGSADESLHNGFSRTGLLRGEFSPGMPARSSSRSTAGPQAGVQAKADQGGPPCALGEIEQALVRVLQDGLPLRERPYDEIGREIGVTGAFVLETLEGWLATGVLRRFGVVVRHHELGYTANAMCVWDIPDEMAADLGRRLGAEPGVTLCYRRSRARPDWPFNLFCMIHGKARDEVLTIRDRIAGKLALDQFPHAVLFSRRRFKQCGARYLPETAHA